MTRLFVIRQPRGLFFFVPGTSQRPPLLSILEERFKVQGRSLLKCNVSIEDFKNGRLRGLAVACWTTDHCHPCLNLSVGLSEGLVFLSFRSETKRALLPNEVTSLDTVRALFVRSFSECLSMQWFDIPSHKIYILDHKTNVFYELDDVREVKDRAVLKIYETGLPPPASGSPTPHSPQTPDYLTLHQHHAGYESDSSIRSAPTGPGVPASGVRSPLHHPPLSPRLYQAAKAQTIPAHNGTYACPQQIKNTYATPYAPGQHPSQLPIGQPQQAVGSHWSPTLHTHPHIAPATQRAEGQYAITQSNQSSPQRVQHVHQAVANTQRHSLACLPDPNTYSDGRISQSRSYHDYPNGVPPSHGSGTATPTHTDSEAKSRMDHMEAQLANLAAWVQTTVMKNQSEGSRPGSARSNSSMISEGSYSAKSSMSDISSATPQPMISIDMQNTIRTLHYHTRDLRSEVNKLRRLQMTNMEAIRESIHDTYKKLKEVIEFVPTSGDQPVRLQRHQVNYKMKDYKDDGRLITQDLIDLEKSVEELRNDVLNRKCRVNVTEIENMALALSNIAKSLGELKAHFPALQEDMKTVMQGEMKIVVEEEKFIREEPDKLDNSLKRCKKLTGTLATLRRLAIVQEHNDPVVPVIPALGTNEEDHLAILEEIKCMVPDHNARVTSLQAAEGARERKKKLDSRGESLRFEKSLALAHRHLKEPHGNTKDHPTAILHPVKEESSNTDKANHIGQEDNVKCDKKCDELVKNKSTKELGLSEESFLAQCKDEENYISALRLSALENSSQSLANGDSLHDVTARSKPLSPSWTSTPKDQSHATVGSIAADSSLSPMSLPSSGQDGKKKIPPPPPPRRSSRSSMKSPTPMVQKPSVNFMDEEQSLHMYENLDDLNASEVDKVKDSVKEQAVLGSPGPRAQRPKSASDVQRSENIQKERPKSQYSPTKNKNSPTKIQISPKKGQTSPTKSQYSPTKMKKLNKFQHELAAGIYSNLNRPDLQQQNVNPAFVVQDATSPESSSSNSSSSTSLDSQLGGTIKRNKNIKSDDKQPGGTTEQKKSPTGKGRKIPPPPPQRKTSTLSQQKDGITVEQLKGEAKPVPSKTDDSIKDSSSLSSSSRLQAQYDKMKVVQKECFQKQLHNGGSTKTGSCNTTAQECTSQSVTARAKDVNDTQPVAVKSVNTSPPLRIQSDRASQVRVQPGQTQLGQVQLGLKQAGQSQSTTSKSITSCTTSKLTTVSNGDVNKTTKSCSLKVEARGNRKFEETEIY
ncbi:hypothetical protein LSH36_99g07034 [Paralvinella palmiformis]|uniref:Actin interacting protein 3 C-terminal domain-containing protein n=1 Tax=Paralvinella palmiformis TaxID=53620 RepID=A0AAD9K024_9ANNE|nr:hypothetical protein LSH36_99g07034 [Paralvinella palmiformis]